MKKNSFCYYDVLFTYSIFKSCPYLSYAGLLVIDTILKQPWRPWIRLISWKANNWKLESLVEPSIESSVKSIAGWIVQLNPC